MQTMNVPTLDSKLAERAVVEHVKRTRRQLARVLFTNPCAHTGETTVVFDIYQGR